MAGSGSPGRLLAAQARVCMGLAAALDPPFLGQALQRLVRPRVEETSPGAIPATVYRPSRGPGPWPAVVVYPGVTRRGRGHPAFVGIGRALATVGYLGVVAEPEGIALGELTGTTVAQALEVAEATADRRDVAGGRIALAGVSGGATIALRVASAPRLSRQVSVVLALAPICDLEEALRFVTTGRRLEDGGLVSFETRDFFRLVCARSLVASLPESDARDELRASLRSLPDYGEDPFATLRAWPRERLDPASGATLELLLNRDPHRFDELLEGLPASVRESLEALSAGKRAGAIAARVELVVARRDKYVPLQDSLVFSNSCPGARLTILDSLEHVVPRLGFHEARELALLDGALVRMLASSYSR